MNHLLRDKIQSLSTQYFPDIVRLRHHFHQYPELAYQEVHTAKKITEVLDSLQIPYQTGLATTGVCAMIQGRHPGKTILIRADMDALPIQENSGVDFSSKVPGVMHACGHDGHTAQALGVAKILNDLKEDLHGTVKIVFQPAEENGGGAKLMIDAGVLHDPQVDAAISCHLWGDQKAGTIGLRSGPLMAATDTFHITFTGRGGHGAQPHLSIDPVVMVADFVMQVQTIASRRINPIDPVVITCGILSSGTQHNIIPGTAKVSASVRMLTDAVREQIKAEVYRIADGIATSYGGSYQIDYLYGFPTLSNDPSMTELAVRCCKEIVGDENVELLPAPSMGSEDFAFFSQEVPSVYYYVGIREGDEPVLHHHESFRFQDERMKLAVETLCWTAVSYLEENR